MPNLDYNIEDPVTDLLGDRIEVGDYVAWGTNLGRSAALCIAHIEKIRFTRPKPGYYGRNEECAQEDAERYTLSLRPVVSTGDVTWVYADVPGNVMVNYDDRIRDEDNPWGRPPLTKSGRPVHGKVKTVQHVKNVVKMTDEQVERYIEARATGRI